MAKKHGVTGKHTGHSSPHHSSDVHSGHHADPHAHASHAHMNKLHGTPGGFGGPDEYQDGSADQGLMHQSMPPNQTQQFQGGDSQGPPAMCDNDGDGE